MNACVEARRGDARLSFLCALAVAACAATGAAQSANPAETLRTLVLSPQYGAVAHLLIFFLVFFGLFLRPLQDRLGRAGTAVAAGLALILSSGLALSGRLHLLNLEPLAALGLFAVFGAAIALAFRKLFEASLATTAALGYVVTYSALRLAMPAILPVVEEFVLLPEALYALALVWLIYSVFSQSFPTGAASAAAWFSHAQQTMKSRPPQARQRLSEAVQDQEALAGVTQQEAQQHGSIVAEIDETIRALKSHAADEPQLRAFISSRLQQLADSQRKVEEQFQRYKALVQRITELDVTEYADLKAHFDSLPEYTRQEAKAELGSLGKKLKTDNILANLGKAVEANNIAVRDGLLRARNEFIAGRIRGCLAALNEVRSAESEAQRLAAQIERFAVQLKNAIAASITRQMPLRETASVA